MIGKLADTAMQERWQGKGGIEVWSGGPMGDNKFASTRQHTRIDFISSYFSYHHS